MNNTHHNLHTRLFAGLFALILTTVLVLPFATGMIGAQTATLDGFAGAVEGGSVRGVVSIQALVSGAGENVAFRLTGPSSKSFIDRSAPFFFNGDTQGAPAGWDTRTVPDGDYTLRATLTDSQGGRYVKSLLFKVANGAAAAPAPTLPVYADRIEGAWTNWSWDAGVNPSSTAAVRSGSTAMAVTYSAAWGGLYLHTDGVAVSDGASVSLWVHGGGVANRQVALLLMDANGATARTQVVSVPATSWAQVVAPVGASFPTGKLTGIVLQERGGAPQPTFYVDDVTIQPSASAPQPQPQPQPTAQPQQTAQPQTQPQPTAQPQPQPTAQPLPAGSFVATFDGDPASPQPFNPSSWDVAVHSRDVNTWYQLEKMPAMHGADCGAPPATHTISRYEDAVFQCRNHVMTAIQAGGYGVIYLTPNHMADFSRGEAVIRWDMSTLRTSKRDWVDVWITPYNENLSLPFDDAVVDLSGPPQNAVNIRMDLTRNSFSVVVYRNFRATTIQGDTWTSYESFLAPDAARRDTFEIGISRTRVRVGMPAYGFKWVDAPIADLGWSQGVVQLGHHSYNPLKDCAGPCSANTWHWDNVTISPARAFTMAKADRRYADRGAPTVVLAQPAPAGASLRFAGIGPGLEVSFDGGKSWQAAKTQVQNTAFFKDEHFRSYWMPIPAGTTQVQFRGQKWWGADWMVKHIAVWAQ